MAAYESRLSIGYDEPATGGGGEAEDERLRFSDVAKLARRAQRRVVATARADDRETFRRLFAEHLGVDGESATLVKESWAAYDHVNVQAGLDAWLAEAGRTHRVVGVTNSRHHEIGFSELVRSLPVEHFGPAPGNVARVNLPCGPGGQVRACVVCAAYLVDDGGTPVVLLFRLGDPEMGQSATTLEVAAADEETVTRVAADVRRLALEHNVYRGQVVSFAQHMFGEPRGALTFHERPAMTADDLVLPPDALAAVTRQVVGVREQRDRLRAAGQHLKRGLLLFGPPGVGKTHTVRYLTSALDDTTIVILSGESLGMIGVACSVARALQPAMIVVEDVDLIAEDRGRHPGHHRCCSSCSTRWTDWPTTPTWCSCSPPTAPTCWSRRWRSVRAGSTRRWRSTCRTPTRGAGCSRSTGAISTSTTRGSTPCWTGSRE
ncbi:AAA family ATPase [Nocardioides iriomotensis]|uniref:AAA family ATPase n=1 Tax=Nocardioides iriomotensis TaxID=715784 RepID=A0A4Q5IZ16_9ACTN|nr:ATP-binding protein [Nocardioides iriomotensis]RYU11420.1 AAA family ATPase [Nocardioides iriomotensis]